VRQQDSESDLDWCDESEPQEEEDVIQSNGTVELVHGIQDKEMDGTAAESEEGPSKEEEDDTLQSSVGQLWEAATNYAEEYDEVFELPVDAHFDHVDLSHL
jgi:hypothetical protein